MLTPDLIAPCGMNCAVCSRYLAQLNGLKRSGCPGCRLRDEPCTYLLAKCERASQEPTAQAAFCHTCSHYPCQRIKRMDQRYRRNYGMSTLSNLEQIKAGRIEEFIAEQNRQHRCPRCGGMISVHNRKCFKCDTVTKLVEKQDLQS